jgi:hypothetical protein
MKVYHLNILGTDEDVREYNRTGGDTPRFRMHRAIVTGHGSVRQCQAAACGYSEGEYQLVVEMPDGNCCEGALEVAWELTNNTNDRGWVRTMFTKPLDCTIHNAPRNEHRSSAVGDIVEREGSYFLVCGIGFQPLLQLGSRNVQ